MEKFAVFKYKNEQYLVEEGKTYEIDKIKGEKGEKVDFDEVLLLVDKDKITVGTPLVTKAVVKAEIVDQVKGEKVTTFKYKAKARYRKRTGQRPLFTKISVTKIS